MVAYGAHDLFHGHVFGLLAGGGRKFKGIDPAGSGAVGGNLLQVGEPFADHGVEGSCLIGAGQRHLEQPVGVETRLHDGDFFLFGTVADVLTVDGQRVLHGLFHIHAQGEVHAALEVQAETDAVLHERAQRRIADGGDVGQGVRKHHEQHDEGDGQAQTQSFHGCILKNDNKAGRPYG